MQERIKAGGSAPLWPMRAMHPSRLLRWIVAALPLIGLGLVIVLLGWPLSATMENRLLGLTRGIVLLYGPLFLLYWFGRPGEGRPPLLQRFLFPTVALLILFSAIWEQPLADWIQVGLPRAPVRLIVLGLAVGQQISLLLLDLATALPALQAALPRRLNPGTIFLGSFALLIGTGTALLKLPNATTDSIGWVDALFTSTSAVCVTGLIVVDTATAFTPLGQLILLGLIQVGAFGIVSLTFFLAVLTGQGFSVAGRVLLKDVLSLENLRGLRAAILFLVSFTVLAEALGCLSIYLAWHRSERVPEALLWVALFHSVSAFCNAGFSLFPDGLMAAEAIGNLHVQGTIVILILLGGLGFPVLMEAGTRLRRAGCASGERRRWSVHLRLALLTTLILLAGGTGLILLGNRTVGETPFAQRLWEAAFTAVTARTAGFHISEMAALSNAATAIVMLLMFIGGSPGSFAGGVKTTTVALALMRMRRLLLGSGEVQLFGRRIEEGLCTRSLAVLIVSLIWIFLATTLLLFLEPDVPLLDLLFETVSAFATVGLSRGITADLSAASKLVLTLTMFAGRIGVLNFLFSLLILPPRECHLRLPAERLIIE